jgi:CheY-like chemotaxis protein
MSYVSMPNVLVTDDEANIRLMLRTALESEGYRIQEASNGQKALEIILGIDPPDLVLLDLNMPVLDGMGVLDKLRAMRLERPPRVIVLTAYGSIPAAVKATRLGAADFLEKPVTPADLRQTIKEVLAEPLKIDPPAGDPLAGGYEAVLDRVRKALRMSDLTSAESLLMKAVDLAPGKGAPYFNLLGVLYEAQRNWRLAKKFYGKAIYADKAYQPSQKNMRRIYELETFGRSGLPVALGDDPDDVLTDYLSKTRAPHAQ